MNRIENYLHEFLRMLFANRRLIKRVFLAFAVITLLLPLILKQSFEITAEVIVQSKKLAQTDSSSTALAYDPDRFIPTSLTDMETESNILRSLTLIHQTISELRDEGRYDPQPAIFDRLLFNPLRRFVSNPLRTYVINPTRALFGLEVDPVRDSTLDVWTKQASEHLKIETLPGSNVVSVVYDSSDPALGTRFVERLLANYLKNRQSLQSNDPPESFYEQKKAQYKARLDDLESRRQALLIAAQASDPKEEIIFRLNAINTEEQALNLYRDRALESQRWLDYLKKHLVFARKAGLTDYMFPFAFTITADEVAFEDREIKRLGEQLTDQVSHYNVAIETYQANSLPVLELSAQIGHTRLQFLKVVENRIQERSNDLEIIRSVIAQKNARVNEYKARVRALQEVQSKLRQLDTEIEALHRAFFAYTQRYEESRGQSLIDGALSNARILSQPYEPTEPAFPKPLQIIPLGLITGLLLAIALGYMREFFDHRFKHPLQIQQHLGLPVLMVINAMEETVDNPHRRWGWQWLWHWARQ
ncbi:MAG: hypothetical protein LBJ59_01375 [Zoogloeaceae bacterium]|jgi:uncharacterized protein involved in exopolysaccharide biosynthesis|nr:hypothetical protein [Zoogloeaceae bacterium]